MTDQPVLFNIRILDFTWVLAGPYATRLLADFGAEVIKVQPPFSTDTEDTFSQGYYNTWNRNKRGITLDLNKPEGIAIARKLVGKCDAVVENFAPRVMANWRLDYSRLKEIRPDIIMVSLSLMGQTGPWRDYSGFGPTVQAFSGMTDITSFPGGPPLGPGFSYADHIAGLYASLALLGALEFRRRTGEGQHVDISQVEVMSSLLSGAFFERTGTAAPCGNSSNEGAPHGVYRCRDNRWCAVVVFTKEEWRGLKKALGSPSWAEEERYASLEGRREGRNELDERLTAWAKGLTAREMMAVLQANGVAAGVVQDAADLAADPHLAARGFFRPSAGIDTPPMDANPIRLSGGPVLKYGGAPRPGQDNDYVYRQLLGLGDSEIARLIKDGVI